MTVSATYICPVRGLFTQEPPEPERAFQASKVALDFGITRFMIPVLEEPLHSSKKLKNNYLDGIIQALDSIDDSGSTAFLITPARRILGLDWVPPYLVKAIKDPQGVPVVLENRIRRLRPYNWWKDISVFQKRVSIFRELCVAFSGHPALKGWIVMDRELDWYRPDFQAADLMLKSILAEIREKDETIPIHIGLSWAELLEPEVALKLTKQVDGIRLSGLDQINIALRSSGDLNEELLRAAYLGTIAEWIFGLPYEIEVGWDSIDWGKDPERIFETIRTLSEVGLMHMNWLSLMDPEPGLLDKPPWVNNPDLGKIGLFDWGLEPKAHTEAWVGGISHAQPSEDSTNFIDLSIDEYSLDPHMHLPRLWEHFRDIYT